MSRFPVYCPRCAANLGPKDHDADRGRCPACGFVFELETGQSVIKAFKPIDPRIERRSQSEQKPI